MEEYPSFLVNELPHVQPSPAGIQLEAANRLTMKQPAGRRKEFKNE